jgi:soluble lytic murein transglycosylase-like protein
MNVGRQWAGRYGLSVSDLRNPATNVLIGARILSGIQANLGPNPSVAEIYTLYNQLDASRVSWRGVAVQRIYENQRWAK